MGDGDATAVTVGESKTPAKDVAVTDAATLAPVPKVSSAALEASRRKYPASTSRRSTRAVTKKKRYMFGHFLEVSRVPAYILSIGVLSYLGVGLVMIGIGAWALAPRGDFVDLVPNAALQFLTAVGFCLVVVATIGAYGSLNLSRRTLIWFTWVASIVTILQLIAGIVLSNYVDQQAADYKHSILTGGVLQGNDVGFDAAMNASATLCCATPSNLRCQWLDGSDIVPRLCSDPVQFRVQALDVIVKKYIEPISIADYVLLVPQVGSILATIWLLWNSAARLNIVEDDEDLTLPPVAQDEEEPEEFPWSFALLFDPPGSKTHHHSNKYSLESVNSRLRAAGLETRLDWSSDKKTVVCRVRARRRRLELEADRINMKLRLDPVYLRAADRSKNETGRDVSARATELEIVDLVGSSKWDPYIYIYGKYDSKVDQALYRRDRYTRTKLRQVDIIKLIVSIIEAPLDTFPRGADLALDDLKAKGHIKQYFPLHDEQIRHTLQSEWYTWFNGLWDQPLSKVRDYFGEQVALYFTFLGHYTMWLLAPSMIGLGVFVHQRAAQNLSVITLPLFGIFTAIWATGMLEFWKRREATCSKQWGMTDFEAEESTRPQFNNNPDVHLMPSPVTGLPINYYPPNLRRRHLIFSWITITVMIAIVLVCVLSIFALRTLLVSLEGRGIPKGLGGGLAAGVNAVQIQILNLVYGAVANKLNDWENHPTDTLYQDNLIAKTFCFQFINSFFSLFYIAFLKNNVTFFGEPQSCLPNAEGVPDCIGELSGQLGVIFISRLVVGNITEVGVPWVKQIAMRWLGDREAKQKQDASSKLVSPAEEESKLQTYNTFDDYSEMVIQFGYVSLFVVAFPLAPALALLSNYVEIRMDAIKLLRTCARPDPMGAQDIGTWYKWLDLMGNVAVVTNMAVILFTSSTDTFSNSWIAEHPVWMFLFLEHAVFAVKYAVNVAIPDVPAGVDLQVARQTYLVDKHILNVADDILDAEDVEMELKADAMELTTDAIQEYSVDSQEITFQSALLVAESRAVVDTTDAE